MHWRKASQCSANPIIPPLPEEREQTMTTEFDLVFAVPGENSIIDCARPDGRSQVYGETLDEVRQRHPNTVLMPWETFRAEQAARQNTPITWSRVTQKRYNEMLEVLPPAYWDSYGFMVGEACDHSYETGRPRFQAFRVRGGSGPYPAIYEAASRPMTVAEFKAIKAGKL